MGSYILLLHQQRRSSFLSLPILIVCLNVWLGYLFRIWFLFLCFTLIIHILGLQATIRQLLMLSMDDRIKRIRTVIAMVVTLIVNYDWPEEWPELLPHLLKLISDQTNVNGGMLLIFLLWNFKFFILLLELIYNVSDWGVHLFYFLQFMEDLNVYQLSLRIWMTSWWQN